MGSIRRISNTGKHLGMGDGVVLPRENPLTGREKPLDPEKCIECASPLHHEYEKRLDGYIEHVIYCEICGATYS